MAEGVAALTIKMVAPRWGLEESLTTAAEVGELQRRITTKASYATKSTDSQTKLGCHRSDTKPKVYRRREVSTL